MGVPQHSEVIIMRLTCPKCRSADLKIRRATGFERIVLLFTSNRKYRCQDCGSKFRAPDRRSVSRNPEVHLPLHAQSKPCGKMLH